jgi:hypothetical protein
VLLLGPPGVGKTHLSIALGREAIMAGYTVQFTTATTLVAGLAKAYGERRLDEKLLALSKPKLLIVDELGYLPLEPDAAHLFFQIRAQKASRCTALPSGTASAARWCGFGLGPSGEQLHNVACIADSSSARSPMEPGNRTNEHPAAMFEKILAGLPLVTYRAGETILSAGLKTGRLLILKTGAVLILQDSIEIAMDHPGAVFGEVSALLEQPHAADVRALEDSQFHVADTLPSSSSPARSGPSSWRCSPCCC